MTGRLAGVVSVVAVLGWGALGCAKNPYQQRREWQQQHARSHAPAELDRGDRNWRAFRTARVRVYVDPAFTQAEGNARAHCEERFARASEVLEPAIGLRLELEDVRELPAEARHADLDVALRALARHDAGADVDFVLGLIGARPVATLSFQELGRASLLHPHLVLRAMDNAAELRALEGYDTLSGEERSRIYQQRKRHKETTTLLHEIGHSLGALHVRDRADIMHAAYDPATRGFAPENVELMRLTLAERLRPAEERDFAALFEEHVERLQRVDPEQGPFVAAERSAHIAVLRNEVARLRMPAAQRVVMVEANADAVPSELAEADRARFAALDAQVRAREHRAAYEAIVDLATRYPDSYAVQHKACQTGMQLGLRFDELQPLCDRMAALAATGAAAAR